MVNGNTEDSLLIIFNHFTFLAGFVSKRIENEPLEEIIKQAVSLEEFITSKSGACPAYDYEEFEKLKDAYSF